MKNQVICGGVAIGGNAPVSIQSMTNTKTAEKKFRCLWLRIYILIIHLPLQP